MREQIPADGEIIEGALKVDQSALNGESREAEKKPGYSGDSRDFFSKNRLFRGSVVCSGEGVMQVHKVGDSTLYGSMAREVQEETRESPLKVRLGRLARTLSRLGYCAAILVALADLFYSLLIKNGMSINQTLNMITHCPSVFFEHLLHAATLAITVVVVAVPEGLPMMITVVLSSNMRKMLKDNVLVRKLVGIETSGSLNILFADKTGTLTRGRLKVASFVCGDGSEHNSFSVLKRKKGLWELVELSGIFNTGSTITAGKVLGGNATDRALIRFISPASPSLREKYIKRLCPL